MSVFTIDDFKKEEGSSGSDFFKIPVGETKIRVVTDFYKVQKLWEGEFPKTVYRGIYTEGETIPAGCAVKDSGWAWCIVRDTGEFKIIEFTKGLIGEFFQLKRSEEYSWYTDTMPYDVTISNTGEGAQRYKVTPARQNTELTDEEKADMEALTPLADIINKIKDKQAGVEPKAVEYPESDETNSADKF